MAELSLARLPGAGGTPRGGLLSAAGWSQRRAQARGKADGELLLATAEAKGRELVGLAGAKALEG
jgi:hypothetical protein